MSPGGKKQVGPGRDSDGRGAGARKLPKNTSRHALRWQRFASGGLAWVLLLAIVTLLTVVIRQQGKLADEIASQDEEQKQIEAEAEINVFKSSILEYDLRVPDSAAIDDAIMLLPIEPPPEDGPAEFSAHWVRQAGLHLAKAEAAYNDNRLSRAEEHYRAARKIFPNLKDLDPYIGLLQVQQKNYAAAAGTLTGAVEAGYENPEVFNNLGVAQLAGGDADQAAGSFERALQLDADYPLARFNLASLYYKQENYASAAREYAQYVPKNGHHLEAVQAYADSLVHLEKWEEASVQLRKLTGEQPDVAAPHFILAQTLSMSQEFDEGMDTLKHAIALVGTQNALAWMARDEFDTFREHDAFTALFDSLVEETKP